MTSLNKDSTFEREDLSEMLSVGRKTAQPSEDTFGGHSRRRANEMAQLMNFQGEKAASLVDPSK